MFLVALLLLANGNIEDNGPFFDGPELPTYYSRWTPSKDSCKIWDIEWIGFKYTGIEQNQPLDFPLPFTINLPESINLKSVSADSSGGRASYAFPYDEKIDIDYSPKGLVSIGWTTNNQKSELNIEKLRKYMICRFSGPYKALDTSGIKEITINDNKAYRLRARWYYSQCDNSDVETGAVTSYFIPTEKYAFFITCTNLLFSRTDVDDDGFINYPEEVRDSILANWEYERTYPNNIAELEQAVEQTFRVK